MLRLISIVFQFATQAADPSWSCETVHRDPGLPGTYYLYCSQMSPKGIELITVGRFVPDTKAGTGTGKIATGTKDAKAQP